jgi:Secretion system C-terminal sorting domain/FG-GAP-like repeat
MMNYLSKSFYHFVNISILTFLLNCYTYPQSYRQDLLTNVKKNKSIKIDSVKNGIYNIQFPDGRIKHKNLNDYTQPGKDDIPVMTFDLSQIDSSLYSNKYSFWKQIPVFDMIPLNIGDLNNNGKPEIYGSVKNLGEDFTPAKIFELGKDSSFNLLYTFNDTILNAISSYDIDGDGITELMNLSIGYDHLYPIFKGTDAYHLPTSMDFTFSPMIGFMGDTEKAQINSPNFIHFDKDTAVTFLFWADPPSLASIYKYNRYTNNLDSICFFRSNDGYGGGFAIDDFDSDGRIEFSITGIEGSVQVIKNIGINQFKEMWHGSVPTYNAYMQFSSNDIDGNGKKELWVGGDAFYNGVPKTVFTAFECSDSNNYVPVCEIDFPGIFSLWADNAFAVDVDRDGVDELFICIGQNALILKFDGSKNYQHYKLFYLNKDTIATGLYYAATMYDLFGDGKKEILISGGQYPNNDNRNYTNIYKENFATAIKNEKEIKTTDKMSIYPNPFNGQVKILINNSKGGKAKVQIYDLLGRLQKTLINDFIEQGTHNINWNGTNERGEILPSGIYFMVFEKQDSFNCQKLVFLK